MIFTVGQELSLRGISQLSAITDSALTYKTDVKYNGITKKVYKISRGSKMGIVKRSDGTLAKYKNTATHELGHLLGWAGH